MREYKELWKEEKPGYPYRLFLSRSTSWVPLHWHDDPEIVVMVTGRLQVRIGSQQIPLEAGEFILIKAGTVHSFTGNGAADCFVVKMLRDSFGVLYLAPLFTTEKGVGNAWIKGTDTLIHSAVSEMVRAFELERPGYDLCIRGNLLRVLGRLIQMGFISEPESGENHDYQRLRPLLEALQASSGFG
ncbi:MAG: cupin domain-containing protein, partial [Spirochaetota bacterium]